MENKVTELFEETSDITEIIIILFLYLFVPEEKQTIRQARERSWYLHKRKQSVLVLWISYCPTLSS